MSITTLESPLLSGAASPEALISRTQTVAEHLPGLSCLVVISLDQPPEELAHAMKTAGEQQLPPQIIEAAGMAVLPYLRGILTDAMQERYDAALQAAVTGVGDPTLPPAAVSGKVVSLEALSQLAVERRNLGLGFRWRRNAERHEIIKLPKTTPTTRNLL